MTKTISLADDAYDALMAVKRPKESFSELARRAAKELARQHLFDPGRKSLWAPGEADALVKRIRADRDATLEPRHRRAT